MAYKRSRRDFEADLQAQQSPFVAYGSPLPPLDPDVRDDGSYVPVWKQDAVDEQGRKRFHGAFTGGYSAGYFNTVGSKEGWTPSTFVSSRSSKHKDAKQQRPDDFMDDEDRAHAAEAQTLHTDHSYSQLGATAADTTYKGSLMDLFKPLGDTMGVKLLRRMGWRDGQGIGPKVKRSARLDHGASPDEHYFAPQKSAIVRFARKDNHKGLGHHGETRLGLPNSSQQRGSNSDEDGALPNPFEHRGKPSQVPARPRGAIGTGILNDQGDEDEDEYAITPRTSYNRTIAGDKKAKKKLANQNAAVTTAPNPLLKAKPVFTPKRSLHPKNGFRRCSDGRLPLDGFVLSEPMASLDLGSDEKKYPLPQVADDWQPAKASDVDTTTSSYRSTADAAKATTLDAKARAAILGEARLPGKSVFDFMSPAARDRIASATGRTDLPPALGEKVRSGAGPDPDDAIEPPAVSKAVALAALGRGVGGWMPYAEDDSKRQRYRAFLEYHGENRPEPPSRPAEMDMDKWMRELAEFAHAAEVFKPMSGMMASRFTTSSTAPTATPPAADQNPVRDAAPQIKKPSDPAEEAARLGMFGPMTRSVHEFYPTRVLCKRFLVKQPDHAAAYAGPTKTDPMSSFAASAESGDQARDPVAPNHVEEGESEPVAHADTMARPADAQAPRKHQADEVDASRNEALEGQKAGQAVYKAIFGDDDSDSD